MRRVAVHRLRSRFARNHGAALLAAMLTVALVATFSAAALWQQWRSIEVESAERERVQSEWLLTGALDWARLVLREDSRAGLGFDHLGEPWAVPLQEARLSSFLAADQNNTTVEPGADVLDAFLSGQIVDLQSFLNVRQLVRAADGRIESEVALPSFARLFDLLGLPQGQLETLSENLRFALDRSASNGSSPLAPLVPQRVEQLVWLGLPANTVAVLKPYITILPSTETKVNLNTASAEVIYAAVPGLSMADAQRLVAVRERAPFHTLQQARAAIGIPNAVMPDSSNVGVSTNFFEVRSRLRLDQLVVEERAVVRRDNTDVKVVQRVRGTPEPDNAPGTANGPGTSNGPGIASGPGATSMGQR